MAAKASKTDLTKVNVIVELERAGVVYDNAGDEEVKTLCPFHEDNSASFYINVKKAVGQCKASHCKRAADIASFLAIKLEVERNVILIDLASRYSIGVRATIDPRRVEEWNTNIIQAGPLLQELYARGITDDMIRRARIGYDSRLKRITIPIYDASGHIVNVRKYLPGAPGAEKMRNIGGYGSIAVYRIGDMERKDIWICGGELKALLVGTLLEQFEIGAVSATEGEGNWSRELSKMFTGKRVFICMDVDPAGQISARKIATRLQPFAEYIGIIQLPLDKEKYPKGDVNNYVGGEKATAEDLRGLMDKAEKPIPIEGWVDEVDNQVKALILPLAEAARSENVKKNIMTEAVVSAMDTTPYIVPHEVVTSCDRDQRGCDICPVFGKTPDNNGLTPLTVNASSAGVLSLMDSTKKLHRDNLREGLGIPICKSVTFHAKSHYDVYDVRLIPQLSIGAGNAENVVQSAIVVGRDVELNTPYVFSGKAHPSPKNQQMMLVLDDVKRSRDDFSFFHLTPDELAELAVFRTTDLNEKLKDIYDDFAVNITRIFGRQDLHFAVDLVYHSPLYMMIDDRREKGWINALIVGDSAQGKSETTSRLIEHYQLGERVDCKSATPAGLLGGLQKLGDRWFISWGLIPTHDRRLLVMEEIKGTSYETLAKLTDMRSSGVAEINRIEKRRAHARTRLIMVSNPRFDRAISAYNFGIEALKELIGSLEDLRRFDLGVVVSTAQVPASVINDKRPRGVPKYESELCRRLILWIWTRQPEQVVIDSETFEECKKWAAILCAKYHDSIPLVDRGTMRQKLARMACALAARTFSTNEDMDCLLVKPNHVEYVARFIDKLYSDSVFGYLDYSKAQEYTTKVSDPVGVEKHLLITKHPKDLVENLLHADEIVPNDFCDWCEVDRDTAQKIMSLFVRKHAIYRKGKVYQKSSEFIAILKKLIERDEWNSAIAESDM